VAQARRRARAPLAVELTIPGDRRFVETAHALSVRVAEVVGYDGPEAAAIGAAVADALADLVAREPEATDGCIEVQFSTGRGRMTIDLTPGGACDGPAGRPQGRTIRLTRPLPRPGSTGPAR
jgi:hypothetical protein